MSGNQDKRSVRVARDGIELGMLSEAEVTDLLAAGFLRTTDVYLRRESPEWKPLDDWQSECRRPATSGPWLKNATRSISSTTGALAGKAGAAAGRLTSYVSTRKIAVAEGIQRLLEGYIPEIRGFVAAQAIARPSLALRSAVADEEVMRNLFGAVYDCLPKPVRRFVPELLFVEFCLRNKRRLFGRQSAVKITPQSSA